MSANSRQEIPEHVVFGESEAMGHIRQLVLTASPTDVPILILGESGTGKEVIARAIHASSCRSSAALIKVNCPAIPGTLLESELLGYEQGAFTGAYESKAGLVELAENGTLFLDEIAEMEAALQAKLLQLLQDGTYVRIGGHEEKHSNARLICATNRQLDEAIQSGTFRRDLFYRINVVCIEMPPLHQRRPDIPVLAAYFLKRYQDEYGIPGRSISPRLMRLFLQHNWPGNIRELENLIKRFVIVGSEDVVADELLGHHAHLAASPDTSLKTLTNHAVRELERKLILGVLYDNHWNRKKAAQVLKISYRALFYKMKDAGVSRKRSRPVGITAGEREP